MRSFPVSIPVFLSTRDWSYDAFFFLCKTGFSPQFHRLRGSLLIWECIKWMVHLLFLCESFRSFGCCCVTLVDIRARFFTIGLYFWNLSNFFVRDKAKNSLFGSRELSLIVVALRISFKLPEMISLSGYVQMTVAGACVTSVGVIYTHWLESVV